MSDFKRCKVCGVRKPLTDFYALSGMRDGHRNDCKACNLKAKHDRYVANPEPTKQRVKRWQVENRDRHLETQRQRRARPENKAKEREGHLKRTHGITLEEYEAMVVAQKGRCKICGRRPTEGKSFHIDHDHVTGRVRGLLCSACNHALGLFGDSPQRLQRAATYVWRDEIDPELARARFRQLLRQ